MIRFAIDTAGPDAATIDRPPAREAAESPLSLDFGAARERIGYDLYRIFVGLWRELAEVFLLPGSIGIDL